MPTYRIVGSPDANNSQNAAKFEFAFFGNHSGAISLPIPSFWGAMHLLESLSNTTQGHTEKVNMN